MDQFIVSLKGNNKKSTFYTGLRYLRTIALFNFISPARKNITFLATTSKNHAKKQGNYKVTSMHQLILVLTRLRTGLLVADLSYRCDLSVGLVSKTVTTWIQFLWYITYFQRI